MPKVTNPIDANSTKIINLATPTNPADAVTKQYADGLGGGSSAPEVHTLRIAQYLNNATLATATNVGFHTAPALTATATNSDDVDGPWINHATTAVLNNTSGVLSTFTHVRRDWQPTFVASVKTAASLAVCRIWVGLFSASPDAVSSPTAIHCAAFRYETTVDATAFWRTVTSAVSASPTVTTTTQAIAVNTVYRLRISFDASNCYFYVNDVLAATHTATLPTATTYLGLGVRMTTKEAVIKNIKWGRIAVLHK